MEDRATAHTADNCRKALADVCSERASCESRIMAFPFTRFISVCVLLTLHTKQTALCKNTHSLRERNIRYRITKRCRVDTIFNFVRPVWKRKFGT